MEWNHEESLMGIAKASVETWKSIKDGKCIICGNTDAGYYDLCMDCQDKPIPGYEAFHICQLFGCLHRAVLSDMELKMCKAYDAGEPVPAVKEYRDYCFSFGTPGRLYYNDRLEKAERSKEPTPGCSNYILKLYGNI